MLGDVQDIYDEISRAAERFLAHKHRVDPNVLAMIVTVLNGKLASLRPWLAPPDWTDTEVATMLLFIEQWGHEEKQIERLRPRFDAGAPNGYLDLYPPEQWFPIPTLEIPKRILS